MNRTKVRAAQIIGLTSFPAPFLSEIIADSYMPNITKDFRLIGAYFTPNMVINIEGQTINNIHFINDNEVVVNITTNSNEGAFDITLDNGLEATFNNALILILGNVIIPKNNNFSDINNINVNEKGAFKIVQAGVLGDATIDPSFITIGANTDFEIRWNRALSPLYNGIHSHSRDFVFISLHSIADGTKKYSVFCSYSHTRMENEGSVYQAWSFYQPDGTISYNLFNPGTWDFSIHTLKIRRVNGQTTFMVNDSVLRASSTEYSNEMFIKISVNYLNLINFKYIELT